MKLLLDTHVVIWLALDRNHISQLAIEALATAEASFISVASAWEYEIKRKKMHRKGEFDLPFAMLIDGIPAQTLELDFAVHPYASSLEAIHSDPFDRMLIAQALHHGLTIVTADKMIKCYPVPTLW